MTAVNRDFEPAAPSTNASQPLLPPQPSGYARLLVILDLAAVILAVGLAHWLRFGSLPGIAQRQMNFDYSMVSINVAVAWMFALTISRSRSPRIIGSGAEEYQRVFLATLAVFGAVAIVSMAFKLEIARGYLAIALPSGLIALLAFRWIARRAANSAVEKPGRFINRVLGLSNAADGDDAADASGTATRRSLPNAESDPTNSFADNVRPLNLHRGAGTHRRDVGETSLEDDAGSLTPAAGRRHRVGRGSARRRTGLQFLRRIRAWMVIPVVDFAMIMAPLLWRPPQPLTVLTMAVLSTLLLAGQSRYVARLHLSVLDELPSILGRLLIATAAVSAVVLYLHQKQHVYVFLETAFQGILLVILGRMITTRIIAAARRSGITKHHTVLIGGGPVAAELARIIKQHREYGIQLDGFVDDSDQSEAEAHLPRLGRLTDLDMAVSTTRADNLLVADGSFDEGVLIDAVRTEACQHTELLVVPRLHHFHALTGVADHIGPIPIMRIRNPNLRGPERLIKRGFDIAASIAAIIVLLPLLIAAAVAVRIEGGPGVIFRQIRVGRDGEYFELWKFRTMRPADEHESQTQWSVASDDRVGPVGRLLRCTSIDELPQLWNILRGDMTLVGPRPERPHFVEQFSTTIDRYTHRHRVQVGLTGFAQVSGLRGDTSIADRARYDNFYIENWSLWLDMKIILRTFREVAFYREK